MSQCMLSLTFDTFRDEELILGTEQTLNYYSEDRALW